MTPGDSISVIIPCFNQARYLAAAVRSAIAAGGSAVEVIVVDDGSSDDTAAVLAQFGNAVHSIRQANAGVSAARNAGYRQSGGQLIVFLDADDLILPGALDRFAAAAGREPGAGVFYGGARLLDERGEPSQDIVPQDLGPDALASLLAANRIATPGAVCLRRSACEQVGPFDPAVSPAEDWDYWIRLAASGARFVRLADPVVGYRQHDASNSKSYFRMAEAVRRVATKHQAVASRSWKHWLAWQCGRRSMRYFCWNQILRPQLRDAIAKAHWSRAASLVTRAVFQDRQAPPFYLCELWLMNLAAPWLRTVTVSKLDDLRQGHAPESTMQSRLTPGG